MSDCDYNDAIQVGIIIGFVLGAVSFAVLDCVSKCFCCHRHGSLFVSRAGSNSIVFSAGNLNHSITQSNGRVWINGEEVGTGNPVTTNCTKSLRITADGETLNLRLQPGTPIHIRAEPGVVFDGLQVGNDLHVTGNIEGNGTLQVGDDCTIKGAVTLQSLSAGDNLTIGPGNVTCSTISAGNDISVTGDLYCDQLAAGDDVIVGRQRKRRSSFR
jgi:hypothetical protein